MASKINKAFVSELDQFLSGLRHSIPENDSQRKERTKYQKLNNLRDNKQESTDESGLWEDF